MTIKPTYRSAINSTDPTALAVGSFLGRRDAITTSERREAATMTRALRLDELYPTLFEEPRLLRLQNRATTAAVSAMTLVIRLLRRRVLR